MQIVGYINTKINFAAKKLKFICTVDVDSQAEPENPEVV
jgi:hypothetical protein